MRRLQMNIFLSWSGDRSKHIAEILKTRLPYFFQAVKPWMSSTDIDKGARWSTDIASKLAECSMGIICLTPENFDAPWILFEAGALSKTLDKTHVCPLLFDIDPSDYKGPLVQFQATKFVEDDFKKLLHTINKCLEEKISDAQIEENFQAWWPKIDSELKKLTLIKKELPPKRKDRELLEEILELVRQQTRETKSQQLTKFIFNSNCDKLSGSLTGSSKIRVSNLAEKLGLNHKEVLARLKEIGVEAKTATSLVDEEKVINLLSRTNG
jgi:hypothetical protein